MRADGKPTNLPGALFFGALTAAALGGAALLAYETYSLAADEEPITQRTRYLNAKHPTGTAILTLFLGVLLGHLLWGPPDDGQEFWQDKDRP